MPPFELLRQLPRPVRLAIYGLACLILLYMTLAPGEDVPGEGLVWDKAEHALSWAVLTGAGLHAVAPQRRVGASRCSPFVFGAVDRGPAGDSCRSAATADWPDLAADTRRASCVRLWPSRPADASAWLGAVSPRHRPWEEAADFQIGLKPIALVDWLEGGEADPAARKDPLMEGRRGLVWAETAESLDGQAEVLEMVEAALGPAVTLSDPPPLYAAARRLPDDLCLMEKRDGQWRLTALSLSAGSFFTAEEVIGRSLGELHGPVTGFAERFLVRVQRIFEGLRPDLVLERRNWTVLNSDALHTPTSAPIRARIGEIAPAAVGEVLHLRVERQTLRRLPRTGGALFTIRVWLAPCWIGWPKSRERLAAFAQRLARGDAGISRLQAVRPSTTIWWKPSSAAPNRLSDPVAGPMPAATASPSSTWPRPATAGCHLHALGAGLKAGAARPASTDGATPDHRAAGPPGARGHACCCRRHRAPETSSPRTPTSR